MADMREVLREGQQPEMPRHTEGDLPEAKIFDLLSSVGNGENKALELIVMREGVIYSKNALWQEVMGHQTKGRAWRMSKTTPFSHCEDSLSPIGLVTREALSLDGTAWGYEITQYGIETGVPFAGALLKWSYEHPEYHLYRMFASTNSNSIKDQDTLDKKRAQETRYKILRETATNPNNRIRLTNIAEGINQNSQLIIHHLESLKRSDVITYKSTQLGKSSSYFRRKEVIPDEEPKQYKTYKTLSTKIYDLLTYSMQQRPNEYLSVEELINLLIQKYPEYETIHKQTFSKRISRYLSNFERQGHVEREKFSRDFRSEITLSDEQREAIISLVTLVDNFKNGDRETIEQGRRFAQKVASDPNLFSELMLKAKEASPAANATSREDMEEWLISILHQRPNSTVKQIQQTLEEDYNKRLEAMGVNYHLSRLTRDEKIASAETKSGNVYRVVETENNH